MKRTNNNILKNYKKVVTKTKKKDLMNQQKKETKYTLEVFLDNKPKQRVKLFHYFRNQQNLMKWARI